MKCCSICKTEKPESEFNKNKYRSDGLQTICRSCSQKRSKKYYKENKEKHKSVIFKRNKSIIKRNTEYVNKIKLNGCVYCEEKEPCCIDFHHIKGKKYPISRLVKQGYSIETIDKEIEKCILVCSNCHRKIHHYGIEAFLVMQ